MFDVRRIALAVDDLPDETLLAGMGRGGEEVAVAFIRRFQRKVYGVALAVTGDVGTAEDVAQRAFEQAWRHARTYDPRRGSVGTWLAAITRNLAIDAVRVRRPQLVPVDELLLRIGAGPDDTARAALGEESRALLRRALRQLPPEQARAICLAGILGFSASEVADAERIPLGTAKTRIRTALRRLRSSLEPSYEAGLHDD